MRLLGLEIRKAPPKTGDLTTARQWRRALSGWKPLTPEWWTVIAQEAFAQGIIGREVLERLQEPPYASQGAIEPIGYSKGHPSIYELSEPLWHFYNRIPHWPGQP
jgi:hypothetical protein